MFGFGGDEGNALRQEEFDLLVGELAQLGAEHIVDADVVCISSGAPGGSARAPQTEGAGAGAATCGRGLESNGGFGKLTTGTRQ